MRTATQILVSTILSFLAAVLYNSVMIGILLASPVPVVLAQQQQQRTGTLFDFTPSLGACGFTNTSSQIVASVSKTVFNGFPGAPANPNKNPICQHKVVIRSPTSRTTITAQIVDYFTSTASGSANDIGLSDAGFKSFAPLADGVVRNVSWVVV